MVKKSITIPLGNRLLGKTEDPDIDLQRVIIVTYIDVAMMN